MLCQRHVFGDTVRMYRQVRLRPSKDREIQKVDFRTYKRWWRGIDQSLRLETEHYKRDKKSPKGKY